ncbi:unannotated protein [freshwater metagenome]|uniref:Unannotated protein n=1 Tax=freshwater metagenome TaxID=449393 RepID=A0A6J6NFW4_9ZZZZ
MSSAPRVPVVVAAMFAALIVAAAASAHAVISPLTAKANDLGYFTLAVPTEAEGATTTKIVLTVPEGFAIDSFEPAAGWKRAVEATGSGEEAVVQKVTWTGGAVPTGEDSVFGFLASPESTGTYTFQVEQTYSDGTVVDWNGAVGSDDPAPVISAVTSLGGGGGSSSNTLDIIAIVLGAFGLVAGAVAIASRGGRSLA